MNNSPFVGQSKGFLIHCVVYSSGARSPNLMLFSAPPSEHLEMPGCLLKQSSSTDQRPMPNWLLRYMCTCTCVHVVGVLEY